MNIINIYLQNIPEQIAYGSQSSQTDETSSPLRRGYFNFAADTITEPTNYQLSPKKQMKRTITGSMDYYSSGGKSPKNKNTDKRPLQQNNLAEMHQFTKKSKELNDITKDATSLPKRALPSCLAESFRAVFAAFLWHEGLCQKFNPIFFTTNIKMCGLFYSRSCP